MPSYAGILGTLEALHSEMGWDKRLYYGVQEVHLMWRKRAELWSYERLSQAMGVSKAEQTDLLVALYADDREEISRVIERIQRREKSRPPQQL
jgi:hypothetical protein